MTEGLETFKKAQLMPYCPEAAWVSTSFFSFIPFRKLYDILSYRIIVAIAMDKNYWVPLPINEVFHFNRAILSWAGFNMSIVLVNE